MRFGYERTQTHEVLKAQLLKLEQPEILVEEMVKARLKEGDPAFVTERVSHGNQDTSHFVTGDTEDQPGVSAPINPEIAEGPDRSDESMEEAPDSQANDGDDEVSEFEYEQPEWDPEDVDDDGLELVSPEGDKYTNRP